MIWPAEINNLEERKANSLNKILIFMTSDYDDDPDITQKEESCLKTYHPIPIMSICVMIEFTKVISTFIFVV